MGYNCDSEDGLEAAVIVTLLGEGETLAWCGNCLPAWIDQMHAMFHADDAAAEPVAIDDDAAELHDADEDGHADDGKGFSPETIAAALDDGQGQDELTPADEAAETEAAAATG